MWKKKIIGKCVELKNWVGVELVGRRRKYDVEEREDDVKNVESENYCW